MARRLRAYTAVAAAAALIVSLSACGNSPAPSDSGSHSHTAAASLVLSDKGSTLDGKGITADTGAVTVTHDIIYYEAGKGTGYGEGSVEEEHDALEAEAHQVVTILQAVILSVSCWV